VAAYLGRWAASTLHRVTKENALTHMRISFCFVTWAVLSVACSPVQPGQFAVMSPLASPIELEPLASPVPIVPAVAPAAAPTTARIAMPSTPLPTITVPSIAPPTPSDPRLGVWLSKSTYQTDSPLFFIAEFETAQWELISEYPLFPALIHRTLADCRIEPAFGRGLPPDYSVSRTRKQLGNFLYELNAVKYQDRLVFINYCTHDVATEIATCFGVSFHDEEQACIQEAETVLETLKLVNPDSFAAP